MGTFAHNETFEVEHCCACGVAFAITADFQRRRRNDHAIFYCPSGHRQHYTGKTEAQKLRDELERKDVALSRAETCARELRHQRDQVAKAHRKMRARVMNGVCPCCNRSFDNLRQHMATKHADFGKEQTVRALREAFGMTQVDVAKEAGTKSAYVSMYERGKPVPVEAKQGLEWWLDSQSARA